MRPDLTRLLRPKTIAVLGGKAAAEVIRQCDRMGFAGEIWPVHPKLEEIEGRRAFQSVAELPGAPDAAFLAVNRLGSIPLVAALSARGTGGAVAYAAGFAEAGDAGRDLQNQLIQAAGAMPFLGPNCYGCINYLDGVPLWPDQHGGKRVGRGVGIVTQSGNIALNLTMQTRGLPIAYVVSLGNQAKVGLGEAIEALLDDERVTAIGLHIEGIGRPDVLARALARARERAVPVVVLKTGRSAAGAALTISHTASIAGADAVVSAYLRKHGAVRVRSIPEWLESLKLLHLHGPLPSREIAAISSSGGEAALIADAVEDRRLTFRPLDAARKACIAATVPDLVTVSNPLDFHTFTWADEAALTATFTAVMAADFALTLLIIDFPRLDRCDDVDWDVAVRAFAAAARRTGGKAAAVACLPETMPEARAEALMAAGIVPLCGLEDALAAAEAAADAGELSRQGGKAEILESVPPSGPSKTLNEWEAKQALRAHGLTVPGGRYVTAPGEAALAAGELGFPVVVKAAGRALAHKSERGAVRLGLRNAQAVRGAAHDLTGIGEALLVEAMITDAVAELIVGIGRDPRMGLYLVLGTGGVLVELAGDTRILMLPATRREIAGAIDGLKAARLLAGYRGKPAGDMDAAVAAVMAVQNYALANADRLLELDVNPLMVRPLGHGAVAADALIRLTKETHHDP